MSIIPATYLEKLRSPNIRALFLIWLFFSIITTFVYYFEIRALRNIDVPTHIGAGMVIAAFIYAKVKVKNGRQALALAFIPFILWELIEIGISHNTADQNFIYPLFHETKNNIFQDVSMDTLGFFIFMILTKRRF